jgi:hypothetical protein
MNTTLTALKITAAPAWAEFEAEAIDPLAEARAKAAQEEIDEIETARKSGPTLGWHDRVRLLRNARGETVDLPGMVLVDYGETVYCAIDLGWDNPTITLPREFVEAVAETSDKAQEW